MECKFKLKMDKLISWLRTYGVWIGERKDVEVGIDVA